MNQVFKPSRPTVLDWVKKAKTFTRGVGIHTTSIVINTKFLEPLSQGSGTRERKSLYNENDSLYTQ